MRAGWIIQTLFLAAIALVGSHQAWATDMGAGSDVEREAVTGFDRSKGSNDRISVNILSYAPAHPIRALFADNGKVIAETSSPLGSTFYNVTIKGDALALKYLPGYRKRPPPRQANMLPDGIVSQGTVDIAEAWLIGPTKRYGHGVLGDGIEASGLSARLRDGRILSYQLSNASVFEDRSVRLADLDDDGRDELIVVRSYLDAGAALTVFGHKPGVEALRVVAETEPIGLPYRWLNPAAIADFDGDGRVEIALVVTPHIGGILKMYELRGRRLVEEWSRDGFSNHAMGSRIQAMAAVVDWGKGPVLYLPDAHRHGIRQVYFAEDGYRVQALPGHEQPIITALMAADLDGDGFDEVVYGLGNGELRALHRR